MLSHGLAPTIDKPSRVTDTSLTLIDNIFTNFSTPKLKSALLYYDISDHFPILLQYSLKNVTKSSPGKNLNGKRVFNFTSIEKFKIYLSGVDWNTILNANCSADPNFIFEIFNDKFNYGFNECFSY